MAPRRKYKKKSLTRDPRYLNFCARYRGDLVGYLLDHAPCRMTWQQLDLLEAIQEPGCRVAVASGHGCFGKGTPIRMFDWSVKFVEDINPGDEVMGPDGSRRTVNNLCSGREILYLCRFMDGGSHIYNEQHVLYLRQDGYEKPSLVNLQDFVLWEDCRQKEFSAVRRGGEARGIDRIYPVSIDNFYGFELIEDRLFLHADGTILSNTGKSYLLAWILDWHLRVYPYSNALLTATNVEQVRSVVWKYLDEAILNVDRAHPWMAGWFIKEAKRYYMRLFKDSWYVIPKTASKSAPENVAGQHNDNYLCIVDEASGVEDEIHGVLRGALTHEDNRYVMVSQPTRPIGHFADAFGKLSDLYTTFNLNAELSPIVSKKFIREKLIEYGGHHSPEYQIKVLGCLPDNLTGYLIPKRWLEICQGIEIQHDEPWGWVVTVDVAEGVHRDSSVWTIGKVSGYYENRKVEVVECREFLDLNEKEFARKLYHRCLDLPSVTIAVDGDGAGRTVILKLDELGMQCEAIHWGLPCHSEADKRRYRNQRAYASVKVREAVFEERMKIAATKKIVEEGAKIPYDMDERGRYAIWTKERMRGKGIKSPDVWDTHCFFYLVDYIPVEAAADDHSDDMIKWAREILTGDTA